MMKRVAQMLVPIDVDALVVPEDGSAGPDMFWTDLSPRFDRLDRSKPYADTLTDAPFVEAESLSPGVHLKFHLPAFLTRGHHDGGNSLEFDALPNRWLIQCWNWNDEAEPSLDSWLIRTDCRPGKGTQGLCWPTYVTSENGRKTLRIDAFGSIQKLESSDDRVTKEKPPKLSAIGAGDPAFSANYRASGAVLGFHHDISDEPEGRYNYVVSGWYEDISDDPIARQFALDRKSVPAWMAENDLAMQEKYLDRIATSDSLQLVCHSTLTGVTGGTKIACPGAATAVGIGATGAEALSAMAEAGEQGQTLLAALQAGLWGMQDDPETLPIEMHSQRFVGFPGGRQWMLKPENDGGVADDPAARLPHLPDALNSKLNELNDAQTKLNQHSSEQKALQKLMIALWRKYRETDVQALRSKLGSVVNAIRVGDERKEGLETDLETAKRQLNRVLADYAASAQTTTGSDNRYRLIPISASPYFMAAEPSVAISGDLLEAKNTKHPQPIKWCRLSGDDLPSFDIETPDDSVETANGVDFLKWRFPNAEHLNWPSDTSQFLLAEALLLDAASIDEIVNFVVRDYISRPVQRALSFMKNKVRAAQESLRYSSDNLDALEICEWQGNPWRPLFLMWQVDWHSAHLAPEDERLAISPCGDLVLRCAGTDGPHEDAPSISGVSFVSKSMATGMFERLQEHDLGGVQNAAQFESKTIVQALTGFNAALRGKRPVTALCPLEPGTLTEDLIVAGAYSGSDALSELPNLIDDGAYSATRAGLLHLTKLALVDEFGRTSAVIDNARNIRPKLYKANSLRAENAGSVRMNPRLLVPARLSAKWMSHRRQGANANPVLGWLLPNFLDQTLSLYGANGHLLGILLRHVGLSAGEEEAKFRHAGMYWIDNPSEDRSDRNFAAKDLSAYLKAVRDWLLELNADDTGYFFTLLQSNIEMTETSADQDALEISPLIGRPLALSRVRFELEPAGFPPHRDDLRGEDQQDIRERLVTDDVEIRRWPVRLGDARMADNGLIGAFALDEKAALDTQMGFFPSWSGTDASADQIGNKKFPDKDFSLSLSDPLDVVVLYDPSAAILTTTGCLPRHRLTLPEEHIASAGNLKQFYFQAAPVLTPSGRHQITLPSRDYGRWRWSTEGQEAALYDMKTGNGFLPNPVVAVEGWLQLEPGRLIRGFAPRQPVRLVPRNCEIHLEWALCAVETLELWKEYDAGGAKKIAEWTGSEIPSSQIVTVDRDVTFRLVAKLSDQVDNAKIEFEVMEQPNA